MKTLISNYLLLIICILAIYSCSKKPSIEPSQDVTGQWIWLSTYFDGSLSESNPKTPKNSGINEVIKFRSNTWVKIQNNVHVDSGTYTTGHGSYLPYVGAYNYIYDSIVYYREGIANQGNTGLL